MKESKKILKEKIYRKKGNKKKICMLSDNKEYKLEGKSNWKRKKKKTKY